MFENGSYWIVAGTSAATASLAGVVGLVVESQGGASQGSANPSLYTLANIAESSFHGTKTGNNSVPGVEGFAASAAAFNLAAGLGSVDGAALADNWTGMLAPPSLTLAAASNSISISPGESGALVFTATAGGSFSGTAALSLAGLPQGVTPAWSVNPLTPVPGAGQSTLTLTAAPSTLTGLFQVTVTAEGDGMTASQQFQLQVQPELVRFRPTPIRRPREPWPIRRYFTGSL
jgi:hypothetical protein